MIISFGFYSEVGSHRIAVCLTGLYCVRTLAQLCEPPTCTYLMVVEPNFCIVIYRYKHFAEVIAHVVHLDVGQLGFLRIGSGYNNGVISLVNVVLSKHRMASVSKVLIINR